MNEQTKIPEKELNEVEISNLSDTEFKRMVIRMLKERSENYSNMKKEMGTIKKNQWEVKNPISEVKNTLERINSRLDKAEDQSNLEGKVEKHT